MNMWSWIQLAVYEIFDIVPFAVLAALPFRTGIRSVRQVAFFVAVLYCMGFLRRSISLRDPSSGLFFSVVWIVLYLSVYYHVVRRSLSKLLFVLITVLNYASLVAILYHYGGNRLFPGRLERYPYCIEASFMILVILAVTYPFLFRWFSCKVEPLMSSLENDTIWTGLWLVPATFCVFYYYNIYNTGNTQIFSGDTRNLIFCLLINAGSLFVLSLVLRLAKVSMLAVRLESERHQLDLHRLQYRLLSERMSEARKARHDLRQYTAVLKTYLETGDTQSLRRYIEHVCPFISPDTPVSYCSYQPLNAVLAYYSKAADEADILFHVQVSYPEKTEMMDADLIVLFGNLLENAVEACCRQKSGKRYLRLKVDSQQAYLVIILDNSYDSAVRKNGCSFYSSKREGYGIGLTSIQHIAQKYQGRAAFDYDGNEFHSSVMLSVLAESSPGIS